MEYVDALVIEDQVGPVGCVCTHYPIIGPRSATTL